MAYLCHAEQRGRMTAAAITSDILCKNECPIQGHTFLPNNKNGIMLFHIMMMSMKTAWKWESVNLSSMEKRKVSTFLANEEKKRLLKSGKDKTEKVGNIRYCSFNLWAVLSCFVL